MQQVFHFLKHTAIKVGLFLRANWAYILWGVLHGLLAFFILQGVLGSTEAAIQFTLIIYVVSIGLALSPLGEFVMRRLEGARPVETKKDIDYLMPLFEEVYDEAKARTPSLNKHIKLYISEAKYVNAFAIGRKTVMVARGAIESFSPEELKGAIAHELGHMASGDTTARLLTIVGNGFFSAIVLMCRAVIVFYELVIGLISKKYVLTIIISFIVKMLFSYTISAFLFVGSMILALNSRYREYLADDYAYQIGFGEGLKDMLYQINSLHMGGKRTIKQWLRASHPHTTARIARLEKKLELV